MALRPIPSVRLLRTLNHALHPRRISLSLPSNPTKTTTTTSHRGHSTTSPSPSQSTSSINPTEISHFSALASTWWDPHGSSRLLHLMNPLRHDFINSCLASTPSTSTTVPPKTLHYLDVGCGGGIFTESAARLPSTASVTGIDPSPEVISVARAHARRDAALNLQREISSSPSSSSSSTSPPLTYLNTPLESLSSHPHHTTHHPQGYSILTLFEVLEHTTHPATFLSQCLPLVKPGGWLILSTITRSPTSWLTHKLLAEDVLRIVPRGTHDWKKFLRVEEVRGWFAGRDGWGGSWTDEQGGRRDGVRSVGCVYIPGWGWRMVEGGEGVGNYFFGIRKDGEGE